MREVHIEIRFGEDGFPSPEMLALRNQIEDFIDDGELGEIVDAGSGMGVMDIYVSVSDPDSFIATVKEFVTGLGAEAATTYSVRDE